MSRRNAIQRFIDVDQEPRKDLLPIEGYEKKPLLSLREAVACIETPIHNLEEMIWITERNCRKPSDGLTPDESGSIHLYTMEGPEGYESFYTIFNKKLRSERRNELRTWYCYMKLFFTALQKLPSLKMVVWRGIREKFDCSNKKDLIWWGVSSCTEQMDVMRKFIGDSGKRTIFMIDCINGKRVGSHSFHENEEEIILMPGTYLHIIDKTTLAKDLDMIRLREDKPPYTLLMPPSISSEPTASNDILTSKTRVIRKSTESNSQASSSKSMTASVSLARPRHKNSSLEKKIHENKEQSELWLNKLNLTDNDMEIVAYYLLQLSQSLTTLYLHENRIGEKGAQYLGEGLKTNSLLSELYLHNNQIGDNGVQQLAFGLSYNRTLTELSLSGNQIGAQGALHLSESLLQNKTLTRLDLSDNQIGAEGVRHLSEGLRKNRTLVILDLSNNQIGVKGAQYLRENLQGNNTITTLFLDNNQIGDKGAQYLSEGLEQNKTLIKLELNRNQIGSIGGQYLDKLRKNNRHLSISW